MILTLNACAPVHLLWFISVTYINKNTNICQSKWTYWIESEIKMYRTCYERTIVCIILFPDQINVPYYYTEQQKCSLRWFGSADSWLQTGLKRSHRGGQNCHQRGGKRSPDGMQLCSLSLVQTYWHASSRKLFILNFPRISKLFLVLNERFLT